MRSKISKLLSLALVLVLLAACFPLTGGAKEWDVTRGEDNYTVSFKDLTGGIYISNRTSLGTAVGTEYYMTYTVKSVNHKGNDRRQQGIIGTNVPGVAFPYSTPESDKGGLMKFDLKDNMLVEGNTYFLKCTITKDGYDYRLGWAQGDKSRYIEFSQEFGNIKSDLGFFGVWMEEEKFDAELIKVRCYDKHGNDLGVQINRPEGVVYVDEPMQKNSSIEHSYDIKVDEKIIMNISNKYLPTSDKVFIEYTVKSGNKARLEQVGLVLTDAPYLGFPYTNGFMRYNQLSRVLKDMTPGPLLEEGASYIILFERKADRLETIVEKTIGGKTTMVNLSIDYGTYIKTQNFFSLWFSGIAEYASSYELVNFKCYDSNGKNLGVFCNLGAEITHYGPLENYEDLNGIFYNKEDGTFFELYDDKTAAYIDADTKKDGKYTIDDHMVLTTTMEDTEFDYFYTFFVDKARTRNYRRLGTYDVTFDTGKGSDVPTQTVGLEQGHRATEPEAPTLEGTTFVAWCTADGEEYDFDSVVTGSTTLYAKWADTEYVDQNQEPEPSPLPLVIAGAVVLLAGLVVAIVLIIKGKKVCKD